MSTIAAVGEAGASAGTSPDVFPATSYALPTGSALGELFVVAVLVVLLAYCNVVCTSLPEGDDRRTTALALLTSLTLTFLAIISYQVDQVV